MFLIIGAMASPYHRAHWNQIAPSVDVDVAGVRHGDVDTDSYTVNSRWAEGRTDIYDVNNGYLVRRLPEETVIYCPVNAVNNADGFMYVVRLLA